MKRIFLIAFFLITVTACTTSPEIPVPTNTLIPPTPTPGPTETPLPGPTPTPEPYLLEDGFLMDWDEEAGDYVVVSEGIDTLTTTAKGEILAVDGSGISRFVLKDDEWVEIKIPDGLEKLEEFAVPDRWVVEVVDGEVKRVKESGLVVYIDPENGEYKLEKKSDGEIVLYEPRTFFIGGEIGDAYSVFVSGDVPVEIIESAKEMVLNVDESKLFTRNGELVSLGYDEEWGVEEWNNGGKHMWWFGVNLGVGEYNYPHEAVRGRVVYVGTLPLSRDIFVAGLPLPTEYSSDYNMNLIAWSCAGGEIPEKIQDEENVNITLGEYVSMMNSKQAIGEVIHLRSSIYSEAVGMEWNSVLGSFATLMSTDSKIQLSEGYVDITSGTLSLKDEVWAEFGY